MVSAEQDNQLGIKTFDLFGRCGQGCAKLSPEPLLDVTFLAGLWLAHTTSRRDDTAGIPSISPSDTNVR
ncbi:hypothetical protein I552_2341 [Mycobacterium xenopi 3993]|nr:hypothetical protein I552_2341 [Mycobacterium xenopi 3993]